MSSTNRSILLVLGAAICAAAFHDLSNRYGGFRLYDGPPAGFEPHPFELVFFVWYLAIGGVAAAMVVAAIAGRTGEVKPIEERMRALGRSPWLVPGTGLAVLVASLAVKELALAGAPVCDDESVYDFIAKTIAHGRVNNALPAWKPEDLELLKTNFVVLNETGWYGKYPIGHPLLLALGEVVGARFVVCPLLAAGAAMASLGVARRLLGEGGAAITAVLLATSPQLICTAATNHSQNTTVLMLMLAVLGLLEAERAVGRRRTLVLVGVGAALGLGFLARPLPGGPIAVAALAWLFFSLRTQPMTTAQRWMALAWVSVPAALGVAALGAVNWAQSGNPLVSGYETIHGASYSVADGKGVFSASVWAALLRQSFWLFGWPCSFVFLPFAARRPGRPSLSLVWLMLGAGYSYRLIGPKVFVGTTGPVYVAEMVPLLAILTAAGMLRARAWLHELRPSLATLPAAVAIAGTLTGVAMFAPFELSWIARVAQPMRFVPDQLVARDVKQALVFSQNTSTERGSTWALWPPPPPPGLDEPLVYVRRPRGPNRFERMTSFWRAHFRERRAFVLDDQGEVPRIYELDPNVDGATLDAEARNARARDADASGAGEPPRSARPVNAGRK